MLSGFASMGGFGGLGSLVSAGASAYGSHLAYKGQKEANSMNMQLAKDQMKFQERMSNTAIQRMVKDSRLAGVNPIYSVAGGGASSPVGASAQMVNKSSHIPDAVNNTAKLINVEMQKANQEVKTMRSLNRKYQEETLKTQSDRKVSEATAKQIHQSIRMNKPSEEVRNTGYGKKMEYVRQFTGAIGNVFSGSVGANTSTLRHN